MAATPDRDVEKGYPTAEFVAKLRRLADCLAELTPAGRQGRPPFNLAMTFDFATPAG